MILYTVPGSCAFASHVALEMAGADYEVRLAPRESGRTAQSFLEINPKGRVPALVTPEGVLTDRTNKPENKIGPNGKSLDVCAPTIFLCVSLRDRSCGSRPWSSRLSMGRRGVLISGYEPEGATEYG